MAQAPIPSTRPAAITLIYIPCSSVLGTGDATPTALDMGLRRIAKRYASQVVLRSLPPGEVPPEFAEHARRAPTVLVLREGVVVGEAAGAFLPLRELDRVVRCAVEWPSGTVE